MNYRIGSKNKCNWNIIGLLGGTMVGFSLFHLYSSVALKHLSILELLFYRQLLAFLSLYPVMVLNQKRNPEHHIKIEKKDLKIFIIIGILSYFLTSIFLITGNGMVGSIHAALINSLFPLFIASAAAIFLKEKLSVSKLTAIIFGIIGTMIITGSTPTKEHATGIMVALTGGVTWALGTVLSKKTMTKYNAFLVTTYGLLTSSIISLIVLVIYWITSQNAPSLNSAGIFPTLIVGTIGTGLPYIFWNKALTLTDTGTCALAYPIVPIFTTVFSLLFRNQKISITLLIGGLIIIMGIIIFAISSRPLKKQL